MKRAKQALKVQSTYVTDPNGHLLAKSSYYRHRDQLRRRGAEPCLLMNIDDPDSNTTVDLERREAEPCANTTIDLERREAEPCLLMNIDDPDSNTTIDLERRGAEPCLLMNIDDPDSNTTIDPELNNTLSFDSEQSNEDTLALEDRVSDDNDILQEEDDPEVFSCRQLLSVYTEGATSHAESDGGNDLDGVFDDLGTFTSLTYPASF
jgi:hypothetical protein